MQYIYCGEEKTITDITDLDLLFQVYILADKVRLRSCDPVLRIRIRIHRIHMFLGLPDPDPLVRGMDPDPDPSIIMQK
jgi:hypothetical protein